MVYNRIPATVELTADCQWLLLRTVVQGSRCYGKLCYLFDACSQSVSQSVVFRTNGIMYWCWV